MNAFNNALNAMPKFIKDIFAKSREVNVSSFISEANKHKPPGTRYSDGNAVTYRDEMATRNAYRKGSMRTDMVSVIKRRFKKTYPKIEKEQINLRLVQREIKDKAKVFCGTGEFYLIDKNGERQENDNFNDMLSDGLVMQALKEMDSICRSQHRCMMMPWWDGHRKHLMTDAWVPYLVHIIPSKEIKERGNVDRARMVGFEHYGVDGPSDSNKRYEFWGMLDANVAKSVGRRTIHFVSDGTDDYSLNDDDMIPYTDPDNDGAEPIYPFVFFRDSKGGDLFVVNDEDMLTINRMVNSGLTDLGWAIHAKANGKWVHTKGNQGFEFGYESMDPGVVVDIEAGATLEDVACNIPVEEVLNFWTRLIDYDGILQGQGKSALQRKGADSASGISLKIRDKDMIEDRKDMIGIYLDPVMTFLRRCQIVHNYHCDAGEEIPFDLYPRWSPGEPDLPVDQGEETDNAAKEQAMKVADPADLRMRRYKETREEAEKAVIEKAEFMKRLADISMVNPMAETVAAEMARMAAGNEQTPQEGDDKKPPVVNDEPKPEEREAAEKAGMNINLYQIAVAIDRGAATPADMYIALHPETREEEAKRAVKENIAFNNELAAILAKAKKIERDALGGKPNPKTAEEV